jgi:hypothetical protein
MLPAELLLPRRGEHFEETKHKEIGGIKEVRLRCSTNGDSYHLALQQSEFVKNVAAHQLCCSASRVGVAARQVANIRKFSRVAKAGHEHCLANRF